MSNLPAYPLPSDSEPPDAAPAGHGRLGWAVAFGVVLPVACLALDPVVFRSSDALIRPFGTPVLGAYRVAGHSAAAIGIVSLVTWLTLRRPAGLLAGTLAGGAVFALGLGVLMLPFTFLGLFILVGVLGLVPFGTAWVFARNARVAWRAAGDGRATWAVAGVLIAGGLPSALQGTAWEAVRAATEMAISADPGEAERGVERLKWLGFATDADELVWAFEAESDPARRRRLADVYRRLTGNDVEYRLAVLRD